MTAKTVSLDLATARNSVLTEWMTETAFKAVYMLQNDAEAAEQRSPSRKRRICIVSPGDSEVLTELLTSS